MQVNTVKKLKVIEFLSGMHFATIVTNLFVVSQGVSLYHAVLAQSVFAATLMFSEIPTGLVADKFGKKTSLYLGHLLQGLMLLVLVFSPTVLTLYIVQAFRAVGVSLTSGADEALLYEASQKAGLNYKKQSSFVRSNGIAGLGIAGVVCGIAFDLFGNSSFVPLMFATVLFELVIVALAASINETEDALNSSQYKNELKVWQRLGDTISLMRNNKTIFALTITGLLTVCNEYFLYGSYGPFLKSINVNAFWIGSALSIGLALSYVLQRNIYKLENYFSFERALLIIKTGSIAGYLLLGLLTQNTLIVLVLISTIGVFNLEKPIVSDYVNQEIDNSVRATVLSSMSLMNGLSKMLLMFAMGAIIASASIKGAYLAQGIFMAIGMAISYWLLVRCGCVRRVTRHISS